MSKFVAVKEGPPDEGLGSTIRVVSMRTGLPMETLRAWERRYGFPRPARREGSNRRLYSDADVARLLGIARALEHGYRVGDVVDKPVAELAALAGEVPAGREQPADVASLLARLAADDVVGLESELRHAAAALGPKRFVTEIARPLAVGVGAEWAAGRLEVRHEHLVTECLTTQLRHALASYQDVPARPLVLLATLPGEPHSLPLQMVALYLAVSAAKPRLLGASTPADQIAAATTMFGADIVGLTVTLTGDLKESRRGVLALRKRLPTHVPIWLGGAGAEALDVARPEREIHLATSWTAIDANLSRWNVAR